MSTPEVRLTGCGRKIGPYDCCTVVCGDCLELMKALPDGCVDAVITDPPYGLGVELSRRSTSTIEGDSDTSTRDAMLELMGPIPACVFGSPRAQRPRGFRFVLIWDKSELTGMGDLAFPWKLTHEEIYLFGAGFRSARRDGSVLRFPLRPSWSNHAQAVSGQHPAEKPLDLIEYLLERAPPGVILDPFLGSGTTAVVAKKLGRHFLGFEISPEYCKVAEERIALVEAQPSLFEPKAEQLDLTPSHP